MPETASVNATIFALSFAVYTAGIIAIGIYSARYARRSDEDYFLAGRSLGRWVAALSASASSESGWVTLGLVGLGFKAGFQAYWIIPGCLLGYIFNWFVLARPLRDRSTEVGALTVSDFFAFHFKERFPLLRVLCVVVILVAMLLYVAAQLSAAGKAFSVSFGGIDYWVGVLIGAGIVLLYTVVGGFRAVCWTDFLPALVMVGTLVVFPIYLLQSQGGYDLVTQYGEVIDAQNGELFQNVRGEFLAFTPAGGGMALIGFLLGSHALGINFGYPGQPHVLIRFMALKRRTEAIAAGVISVVWGALVYWGAVTVGMMARAVTVRDLLTQDGTAWGANMLSETEATRELYHELGLVLSAMHLLPGVVAGLVLAAVLAAICSTADSQLVVAASSAANDLYARLFAKQPKAAHMVVNRCVVLGIGIGAVLLVIFDPKEIYKYVLDYGWAILGASFGPQMILVLLWRRASYAGCLAGMLTGFGTAIIWKQVYSAEATGIEVYNLPVAFVAALLINVVVSLILPGKTGKNGR
jgi:sodium/proline symporter